VVTTWEGPREPHTVKGAAANLSAVALRTVAYEAERAARAGELHKLGQLLESMDAAFARTKSAMESFTWA